MNKLIVILVILAALGLVTSANTKGRPLHTIDFDHYWTYDEIREYLTELTEDYPNLAFLEEYGRTSEGRPIEAFVIRRGAPKKTIVVEAGLRPREWLAPMAALYFIHELVEHDYEFDEILNQADLVFIPLANPDGYVYSHTVNRNWNKNRRHFTGSCYGADLNRNFFYQFRGSGDACSENYSGSTFFSEAESSAIRDVLLNFQDIRLYLSLQAFGQQINIPFSNVPNGVPNQAALLSLASQVATAIQGAPAQRVYTTGIAAVLNGVEFGTSLDYAYAAANIPLAFTLRLPQGGSTGWDFPEAQLGAVLSETFRGFLVFSTVVANSD